jgi:hypothetical protein
MADEQPCLGEYLFLLLPVDLIVDEYLAADDSGINIDNLGKSAWFGFGGHEFRSLSGWARIGVFHGNHRMGYMQGNRSRQYSATICLKAKPRDANAAHFSPGQQKPRPFT